jgi:hypothetical protein
MSDLKLTIMKILIIFLLIYGLFEIISNLIHLSKGSRTAIGESARRQHQELPLAINAEHFYYKALVMFILGLLFTASSIIYFHVNERTGLTFTLVNVILHSFYGILQAIMYFRSGKTWGAAMVYSIPLLVFLILH